MGRASTRFRVKVTRRRVVMALVIVALGVLVAWSMRPAPIPAEIVDVTRGPMQVTLDEEGETRVRDRYVVSAPLAGRVHRIEMEPGDPVTRNRTAVATFRPMAPGLLDVRTRAELQARVAGTEATLNGARAEEERAVAELAQAERELQRSRNLAKAGAIAEEQLESAELAAKTLRTALERTRANVRTAQAEQRVARASLISPGADGSAGGQTIVLRSPIDGIVLRRLRESEAVVPQGEALLEIGDISKLEIVADFLSTDAVKIRVGQRTLVERWGGGEDIGARVRRIEPSGFTKVSALGVEEQRVNVIIDFDHPREAFSQLGDRYRVEVSVVVWEEPNVVTVPISSLVRQRERWTVFAVEDGGASRKPVEVGQRNDTNAQILKGLEPGARVIAFPSDDIEDGVLVESR